METVGKYVLPIVAAVAVTGAAVSTTKLINERNTAPLYVDWSSRYPYFHKMLGQSLHVINLINMACISPSWCEEFLGRFESACVKYCTMSIALDFCKERMLAMTIAASKFTSPMWSHATSPSSQSSFIEAHGADLDAIVEWYIETAQLTSKVLFQTSSILEAYITESQHILSTLAEFKNIVHAFNLYWGSCGSYILATDVSANAGNTSTKDGVSSSISPETLVSLKVDIVRRIFDSGLETFITKFKQSPDKANLKYSLGSSNERITTHVQWWALMHTFFVPEMRSARETLGLDAGGLTSWKHLTDVASVAVSKTKAVTTTDNSSLAALIKMSTNKQALSPSSSPKDILYSVVNLARKSSLVELLRRPFADLMPSPFTQCYIPIKSTNTTKQNEIVEAMARRIEYMSKTMIASANFINDFSEILHVWFAQTIVVPIAIPLDLFSFAKGGACSKVMPKMTLMSQGLDKNFDPRMVVAQSFNTSPLLIGVDVKGRQTLRQAQRRIQMVKDVII